ncbi:MAG: transposase [Gammaproteobacteria bacterium]|nr:transposase [Gammaproteobacteria bacterium]
MPAQYVKPYRRRNKSDRIDTEALLEAHRCQGIQPVPVRSVDQQQLQQLHRVREQRKKTRTARINALRGFLRELGFPIAEGPINAKRETRKILDNEELPAPLTATFSVLLEEIQALLRSAPSIPQDRNPSYSGRTLTRCGCPSNLEANNPFP